MKTKQPVTTKSSHPVMGSIRYILANTPRKHVSFEADAEYNYNPSGLQKITMPSIAELEKMLLSAPQLDRINTQTAMLKQIIALVKEVNNLSVLNGLGIAPLIAPEALQLLMHLDHVVEKADYANTKLGRGAVIAKARLKQEARDEEVAKAEEMKQAITGIHGAERANDILKNRKVA